MTFLRYINSDQIENYFAICEIIVHEPLFGNLGDLITILAMSDKPRANSDPELKAVILTMIKTLMTDLNFMVLNNNASRSDRLKTIDEVACYLNTHWDDSTLCREELLFFKKH